MPAIGAMPIPALENTTGQAGVVEDDVAEGQRQGQHVADRRPASCSRLDTSPSGLPAAA